MEEIADHQMVIWSATPTTLQLSTVATMFVDGHGCSVRTITAGRKRYPTGRYASVKAGTAQPWHRHAQRALVQKLEVDPTAVDYRMHPHILLLSNDTPRRGFIPNCVVDRADGSTEIIEVEEKNFSAGRRRECLCKVEPIYRGLGWTVTRISAEELQARTFASRSISEIQQARHTRVSHRHIQIANAATAANNALTLGEFAAQLHDPRVGVAIACALMVRRHVRIELTYPLGPSTAVSPPPSLLRTDDSPSFKVWKNDKNFY